MRNHPPTSDQAIFPPIHLSEERRRATWSVNVDLPADVEARLAEYEKEDECAVWTVMIHEALYVYRWEFWTKEALNAEVREAIEASIRSAETEGTIEATPEFWEEIRKRGERSIERIRALQASGEMGNLLLPKELHAFILERIESGDCRTPTEVVCKAMPYLARERARTAAEGESPNTLEMDS
jgi:hypothetical protein